MIDPRLAAHLAPFMAMDQITVERSSSAAIDAVGDPVNDYVTVYSGPGTLIDAGAAELALAQQRGTVVDKVLPLPLGTDVIDGDWVISGASRYEVVSTDDLRLYRRLLLRKVG